ncbi:MAG: PEP-CTERM sorting domain-containing protein [Phycisphaerae bacterium]
MTNRILGFAAMAAVSTAAVSHAAIVATFTERVNVQSSPFGNTSFPDNIFDDLTSLGATDWVTWGLDSGSIVESNSKLGGVGIGSLTSDNTNRTGALTSSLDVPTTFDYNDGTLPVSASDVNTGVGRFRGNTQNFGLPVAGPLFRFDVPVGLNDNTLYVWFSGFKLGSVGGGNSIKVLDGASIVESATFGSGSPDVEAGFVYEIVYGGGTTTSGNVTIEIAAPSIRQNNGKLIVHAAALTIPEPASAGLVAGGLGLLMGRRRDRSRA